MSTRTIDDPRFIDTTSHNLIIDLANIHMKIKSDTLTFRRMQKSMAEDKKMRDGIIDELTQRAIVENNMTLPFGHTIETLFCSEAGGDE